jgi:hypothetical protein
MESGMKKISVKRIGVLSVAKLMGLIYGCLGILIGILFAVFSMLGAMVGSGTEAAAEFGAFGVLFGIGAIVFMPIFYGTIGFISGAIMSLLYNLFAAWAGGVELEVAE